MSTRPHLDKVLDAYREQVLRWNRQINLVSRQATRDRLERLILQCRNSWKHLAAAEASGFSPETSLWYFDLGSGAGLPGFIWHLQAAADGIPVRTLLVEPREKRAWFLKRLNSLEGVKPLEVLAGRWENASRGGAGQTAEPANPTNILISLKALHLTDTEVLDGLVPFLPAAEQVPGGLELLIARFYPPGQDWNEDLARDLEIPPAGEAWVIPGWEFQGAGGGVLLSKSPRGASLVLSPYRITPS
ncbi:MAG: RsmG family class I SAM-dependent methyltransferase [Candidatus Krumholzibacteriota bacterium]